MKQKTIKSAFTLKGKGLHTGQVITAEFCPAPVNHGYKIQRTDIEGQPVIDCLAHNVIDTQRGTVLGNEQFRVSTIEHAMAAILASSIDNILIRLDGPEMPILDGSAKYWIEQINHVGIESQEENRVPLVIKKKITVSGPHGEKLVIEPSESNRLDVTIDFDSDILPLQSVSFGENNSFECDVASARTFVFVREIQPLLEYGLIKGGDLDNAIVIYEKELPQEKFDALAEKMGVEKRDATKLGYLNREPLRWKNEPARHKMLDIIGDLALVGRPILGHLTAFKPGHTINNQLARKLEELVMNN